MSKYVKILIPHTFNVIILKVNTFFKIICFNKLKKICMLLNEDSAKLFFDKENNFVKFNSKYLTSKTFLSNKINSMLFSFTNYFFQKIKFKGKGFRLKIRKQKKIIKFLFGHSHMVAIFLKNTKLLKCGKYKFTIKNTNPKFLDKITNNTTKIKQNNVYTNRGLRKGRQIICKRKGKKGSTA